jgi:DNA-binding LacI/PurR family transcriptional regulator
LPCDTRELALQETAGFIENNPQIDAIFAVNDSTAIAAMQVVQKMGKKVPDDIAVVGFGDGPNALIACPPLTTVEQKGYEIGMEAIKILINKIENEDSADSFQTKVIPPTILIRESTERKLIRSAIV